MSDDYVPLRDRIAWRCANAALRLGSTTYRQFVYRIIDDGLVVNGLLPEREVTTPQRPKSTDGDQ